MNTSKKRGFQGTWFLLFIPFLSPLGRAAEKKLGLTELASAVGLLQEGENVELKSEGRAYHVQVHSPQIAPLLRGKYSAQDLRPLEELLGPLTRLSVTPNGFIQAADRGGTEDGDPTHYDAVWVRDSLWAYLALASAPETRPDAKRVLRRMLDYLASDDQLKRMNAVIENPGVLVGKNSEMNAIHIRFDGRSPSFSDVMIQSQAQHWNHKQNDAIGLLLDLALRSLVSGEITPAELTSAHWTALAGLPAYFARSKYYEMEDAGAWEEIERTNTSSIALVTSGLEELSGVLTGGGSAQKAVAAHLREAAALGGHAQWLEAGPLSELVNQGYKRIFRQLEGGGESPLYPKTDAHYRGADAALLNLIYPARLSRLTVEKKAAVLQMVRPLIGPVGIRRYENDSYQSGNFWFAPTETDQGKTGDTSSAGQFKAREKRLITGSEAQWFFDSWYSIAAGLVYQASGKRADRSLQLEHFNRALGQITGAKSGDLVRGADGARVPALSLPESYNVIVVGARRYFVPSPIVPLNWAKACLTLAELQLKQTGGP